MDSPKFKTSEEVFKDVPKELTEKEMKKIETPKKTEAPKKVVEAPKKTETPKKIAPKYNLQELSAKFLSGGRKFLILRKEHEINGHEYLELEDNESTVYQVRVEDI